MVFRKIGAVFIGMMVFSMPLAAQNIRPPATLQNDAQDGDPMNSQDESGLVLRLDRLEGTLRTMNGQIEQLQFQNRQLQDALRKLQETAGQSAVPSQPSAALPPIASNSSPAPLKHGDAFEPATQPNAPGTPRALGIGPAPGLALPKDPNSPMDLGRPGASTTVGGTIIADNGAQNPRDEYELGANFLKQAQYPDAENAFRSFIVKHPKDRLVPEAIFGLGETFFQRNRQREAAEQYLKVSTDYPMAPRAPDSMLRLGQALVSLNAHEQACATFQEIGRKYPTASATTKRSAEREILKNKC